MKKSNYATYLNEYQGKAPLQVQKTFKQLKKHLKPMFLRMSKSKSVHSKQPIMQTKNNMKKYENKQNIHPNISNQQNNQIPLSKVLPKFSEKQSNNIWKEYSQGIQDFKLKNLQLNKQKPDQDCKQFSISLNRCNFELEHSADNLFLIQIDKNKQLIVCQKCAQRFPKKVRISQISKNKFPEYSYADHVGNLQQLQVQNKKLLRLQLIQKQNLNKTLIKVSNYYQQMIYKIIEAKQQLQLQIMSVYAKNEQKLNQLTVKNLVYIQQLQQKINMLEKCSTQPVQNKNHSNQLLKEIFKRQKKSSIEIDHIFLDFPINIIENFYQQFKNSKYYLELFKKSHQEQEQTEIQNYEPNQQIQQFNQQIQRIPQAQQIKILNQINTLKNTQNFSHDFQKQLPFNVEYSVSQSKFERFQPRMNDELNKISSSQELLIESLRNQQSQERYQQKFNQKIKQNNMLSHKTQASTQRVNQLKDQSSYSKKNFIKHLHIQASQFDDMMCDEDLTLSNSHPIYENNIQHNQPRKSLKLQKKNSKKSQKPLTLSELDENFGYRQQKSTIPSALITNSSIITQNQNKHQISFEMDQNLMIDANILPSEENEYQNLDIISPAFKLI